MPEEKIMESKIEMFILSLLWVLIGFLIGALANGVRLRPASWGQRGWLYLPGAGALLALLGGWLAPALQRADVAAVDSKVLL